MHVLGRGCAKRLKRSRAGRLCDYPQANRTTLNNISLCDYSRIANIRLQTVRLPSRNRHNISLRVCSSNQPSIYDFTYLHICLPLLHVHTCMYVYMYACIMQRIVHLHDYIYTCTHVYTVYLSLSIYIYIHTLSYA